VGKKEWERKESVTLTRLEGERWNWEGRRNDGKDWEAGKEVEIRMFRVGTREGKEEWEVRIHVGMEWN